MKKNLLTLLLFICFAIAANAQSIDTVAKKADGKNLFKVNLTALPLKTYSVVYERAISKKTALGLGFRYYPEDGIPFQSNVEELLDDEDLNKQLREFKTSNYAITPEIKFYFGKSVFRGFYIAPFARYAVYNASLPFEFEVDNGSGGSTTEEIPMAGEIKTITGGLLFGAQWKLSRALYLDWFILGPQYGSAKGNIVGTKTLSTEEQDALREELQSLEETDIPLVKIETSVDGNGARADFTGPWAGIRAGISLGIRF